MGCATEEVCPLEACSPATAWMPPAPIRPAGRAHETTLALYRSAESAIPIRTERTTCLRLASRPGANPLKLQTQAWAEGRARTSSSHRANAAQSSGTGVLLTRMKSSATWAVISATV